MKFLIKIIVFTGIISLFACSTVSVTDEDEQITNYESPGNLQSNNPIGCENINNLSNNYTPADLYKGLTKCLEQERYSDAVYIFALAGTYTTFDTMRVSDKTAHQAHTVLLTNSLGSVSSAREPFMEELQGSLGNKDKLPDICSKIIKIGAPSYYPRYMIQHGMGAFLNNNSGGDGLIKDFNPESAWEKSLVKYLHCPNI